MCHCHHFCGLKCFWIKRTSMKIYVKTVLYFDSYQKKNRLTTQCLHAMRGSILNCSWLNACPQRKMDQPAPAWSNCIFFMCFYILFVELVLLYLKLWYEFINYAANATRQPEGYLINYAYNQECFSWISRHFSKIIQRGKWFYVVKFKLYNILCELALVHSVHFSKKEIKIFITWLTVCQIESLLPLARCDL